MANEDKDYRKEFLLRLYDQLWNSINRSITTIWQSVSALIAAFVAFSLTEKGIISFDWATALVILICFWQLSHVIDSSYWYNRNLAMITNIERQFLNIEDKVNIQHYFIDHKPKNSMIGNFKIQFYLGVGIAILIILYHFCLRIVGGFSEPLSNIELQRAVPYLVSILSIYILYKVNQNNNDKYKDFLNNSPGINMKSKD